ncbi:MAG TPA: hypothetical protein VK915_12235 [Gaiellaceae bacterium]|nr:hypothetical protein [Gaiellaceae bacterium]
MRRALLLTTLVVALGGAFYWAAFVWGNEYSAVPWGLASVSSNELTVRIAYPRGDRTCYDLERVEKQETATTVVLEVIRRQEARRSCVDIYTHEETDVELDAPLGSRELIDRCAGEPPPSARDLGERFGELWRAGLDRGGPTDDPRLNMCPGSSLVAERER